MSVYGPKRFDPLQDTFVEDLAELRGWRCEVVYDGKRCMRRGTQRHHGLIRRSIRKPELDVLLNYQLVCPECHTVTGRADSKENHEAFYQMQCDRYGKALVDRWIEERQEL